MSRIFLVISLLFSVQTFAKVTCEKDVAFSSYVQIRNDQNQTVRLSLNGIGLMRVLFFKVFYAALYLEDLSQQGELIIQSDQYKVGIIHATMDIDERRLVDLWNDEFDRLCGTPKECEEMRLYHEQFLSYARDVAKNERLYMIAFPDRFEFQDGNASYPAIRSPEYSRLMQMSLIGPEPADAELKKGLLGQKKVCQ